MLFLCYPKCSTCQKAKAFLDQAGVSYELRDIKLQKPSQEELRRWQAESGLPLKKFFNTSGLQYRALELAKENARRAGVLDIIRFEQADAMAFDRQTERGIIVTNPPYGERIMEKQEAEALYRGFGRAYAQSRNWQLYLLSSHTEFERCFGRPADKKRKLYNGMIKCDLFMYLNKGDERK